MIITSIRQQLKRTDRYSIFVDDKYATSLSEAALLESKITSGQELNKQEYKELKKRADDDKIYIQTSRYAAQRTHTKWEIAWYMERKQASPSLIDEILNKLSNIGLIDDAAYARSYIHDRLLLRPTSQRKIVYELRKKHVSGETIEEAMRKNDTSEQTVLQDLITRKRQQTKYKDDLKLMQYLARQGFHYGDIKTAIKNTDLTQ